MQQPMTHQQALGIAATAWCGKRTRATVMDVELAESFAEILMREVNLASGNLDNSRAIEPDAIVVE